MRRREFMALLGSAIVLPLAAPAQPAGKVYRIGFLRAGQPPKPWLEAFKNGLQEHGFLVGQNVQIEFRFGSTDQLSQLAEELVRLNVDVILASASSAAMAAKRVTTSIPIVMAAVYSPVEVGLIPALGRPGGNITGTAVTAGDMAGKRLQLLRELLPMSKRVAMLSHVGHASNPVQIEAVELAARSLGVQFEAVPVRSADDFEPAVKSLHEIDGLLHADTPLFNNQPGRLLEVIQKFRLPAIHPSRAYIAEGGLISYGADLPEMFRRSGAYVAKILKGEKPADLAVEQATKFELVINLKTAKGLGLTVPPALFARADEVIE